MKTKSHAGVATFLSRRFPSIGDGSKVYSTGPPGILRPSDGNYKFLYRDLVTVGNWGAECLR